MAPAKAGKRRSKRPSFRDPWRVKKRKPSTKQPSPEPPPATAWCIGCEERIVGKLQPKIKFSERCTHILEMCRDCLRFWIEEKIQYYNETQIACPTCEEIISLPEIVLWVGQDVVDAYEKRNLHREMEKQPNFRWCLSTACEAGQVHDPAKDGQIFTCSTCASQSCVKCDKLWHPDKECSKKDKFEKLASEALVRQTAKPCPNNECKTPIVKNGGCSTMICSQCNITFCWLCRGMVGSEQGSDDEDLGEWIRHRLGCNGRQV